MAGRRHRISARAVESPEAWLGTVGAGVSRRQEPEPPKVKMYVCTTDMQRQSRIRGQRYHVRKQVQSLPCFASSCCTDGQDSSHLGSPPHDLILTRLPCPRSHPVNATLAGAGYGYGPTSLTGSSFEFDANGQGLYTNLRQHSSGRPGKNVSRQSC